ncbi:hypothetical protein PV707_48020, partial [Streptomyces europaeiscabiei]|nr:hypothetical protein [Streptomyces europaeiscabiei]
MRRSVHTAGAFLGGAPAAGRGAPRAAPGVLLPLRCSPAGRVAGAAGEPAVPGGVLAASQQWPGVPGGAASPAGRGGGAVTSDGRAGRMVPGRRGGRRCDAGRQAQAQAQAQAGGASA